jgi:tetratricopeptide (TPR) repeat protein
MTNRYYQCGLGHVAASAVAFMIAASACLAGLSHQATLIKANNRGKASGLIRYLASSKAYELKIRGGVTIRIPAKEVERVILDQQPAQLASAVAAVKAGRFSAAMAPLTKIKADYEMFGPDLKAAQYLAVAYLGLNKPADAVRMCEDLLRRNPRAGDSAAFTGVYWDALLKEKKYSTLTRILDDAVQTGSRQVAAVALVKRGDILMEKRETKKALLDGYLRVVLMYQDTKSIQPEALYKAMEAHKVLKEHHFVEKWRKRLLAGYPASDYAKKI